MSDLPTLSKTRLFLRIPGLNLLGILFLLFPCLWGWAQDEPKGEPLYTAHNLWFENPAKMSSVNYKTGSMIPAGTPIKVVSAVGHAIGGPARTKPLIHFWTMDDKRFTIFFQPKFHPGQTLEDFKNATFTHQPIEVQTHGFSKAEIDAIRQGILVEGMSKPAVLIAYGPPPGHQTVSLDLDRWRYWIKRMSSKDIFFRDGKTVKKISAKKL